MYCAICNKSDQEADLVEGIYDNKIVRICIVCAEKEEIPLIKKPTEEQLLAAERRQSIRERLEKLSFPNNRALSKEQEVANRNLGKLRLPPKKQSSPDLIDNYDWKIKIARRRKKLTMPQLSQQLNIPVEILENLEKGQLPEKFHSIIKTLENTFDIKLFRTNGVPAARFIRTEKQPFEEEEIIHQVKVNLGQKDKKYELKKENLEKIKTGKFDFSKKENLKEITLDDLVKLKKQREIEEKKARERQQHEDLFGEDVEVLE